MRDNFWLDGEDARKYGIELQREIQFSAAEPDVETVAVPGHSGDIVYFNGRYRNVIGTAGCYCLRENVAQAISTLNNWLMKSMNYRRLETLIEPDVFRMARLRYSANLEARLNRMNPFTIEFDCKAQRYLKSGEATIRTTRSTVLYNPTAFEAMPVMVVHGSGSGTLTVGENTMQLDDCNELTLDSERCRASSGSVIKNSTVHGQWAVLHEGENAVSFTGGITAIEITPRWWTL